MIHNSNPAGSQSWSSGQPPRKLRVAVLNRIFRSTGGGAERYSIALVEHLAHTHEIHVFAQDIDHQIPGVTFHSISGPLRRPRWLNQIWFAVATWWATRKGFDVVHSHENTWHGNVQTAHVMPVKYKLFVDVSGVRLALRWLKVITSPRLLSYLWMENLRYDSSDGRVIVLASDALKRVMMQTFPSARAAMQTVTPGVEHVLKVTTDADKVQARARLGLPLDGRCVLFVGNDFKKKGLQSLLRAMAVLPTDCFLLVVGNPAQVAGVSGEVAKLGVKDRVYFAGSLSSMEQAYRAADCLAHPTLEDTFAMVVLEAMAYGVPVVVSDSKYCGISVLLEDNHSALLLTDPADPAALAVAIRKSLEEPALHALLVAGGLAFSARHEWARKAQAMALIYRSLSEVAKPSMV